MKWGLNGGISIDVDSCPPRYVLWCCAQLWWYLLPARDIFIQIGSGHTVRRNDIKEKKPGSLQKWPFFSTLFIVTPLALNSNDDRSKRMLHWKYNAVQIRSGTQQGVLDSNFSPALKMQLCEKSHFLPQGHLWLLGWAGASELDWKDEPLKPKKNRHKIDQGLV